MRSLFPSLVCIAAVAAVFSIVPAQEGETQGKPTHSHDPIEIEGTPVISRIEATLEHPRRLLLDDKQNLWVVDSGLNQLLRISKEGKAETIAEDLQEPSGLLRDAAGNVYISNHADGEEKAGSVVRISPDGKQEIVADKLTGPKGLAMDQKDRLYVALFDENKIVRIDRKGQLSTFVEEIDTPAGLVFDNQGDLFVACSLSGTVRKVTPEGKVTQVADGLQIPSDITAGPDGGIVVAGYRDGQLTHIDPQGNVAGYLNVPAGTIGLTFDKSGNLVLAHWDGSLLLKITHRFTIPCPHCHRKIPVRLKPKPEKTTPRRKAA